VTATVLTFVCREQNSNSSITIVKAVPTFHHVKLHVLYHPAPTERMPKTSSNKDREICNKYLRSNGLTGANCLNSCSSDTMLARRTSAASRTLCAVLTYTIPQPLGVELHSQPSPTLLNARGKKLNIAWMCSMTPTVSSPESNLNKRTITPTGLR
jgi:hypothetical protein